MAQSILQSLNQKVADFLREPHFPFFLLRKIRTLSPLLARILQYGRYNPNTAAYWNRRYASGEYAAGEDERYGSLRRNVISHIPYGGKVLDAGCGSGRFLEMLREKRSCQGVGLDISDVAGNLTASRGFAAFVCRLPDLPKEMAGSTFDVCVLLETLEHISKPIETIERLATLLKKDGLIMVSVPDNCMTPEEFDEHVSCFTQQTLGDLLRTEFHLEVMTSYEVSGFRYLFAVGRKVSDVDVANIQNGRRDGPVLQGGSNGLE